jgi:hypothetical protein
MSASASSVSGPAVTSTPEVSTETKERKEAEEELLRMEVALLRANKDVAIAESALERAQRRYDVVVKNDKKLEAVDQAAAVTAQETKVEDAETALTAAQSAQASAEADKEIAVKTLAIKKKRELEVLPDNKHSTSGGTSSSSYSGVLQKKSDAEKAWLALLKHNLFKGEDGDAFEPWLDYFKVKMLSSVPESKDWSEETIAGHVQAALGGAAQKYATQQRLHGKKLLEALRQKYRMPSVDAVATKWFSHFQNAMSVQEYRDEFDNLVAQAKHYGADIAGKWHNIAFVSRMRPELREKLKNRIGTVNDPLLQAQPYEELVNVALAVEQESEESKTGLALITTAPQQPRNDGKSSWCKYKNDCRTMRRTGRCKFKHPVCNHGANCKWLLGDGCSYQHTEQEVREALAKRATTKKAALAKAAANQQ